jgi:putative esterase
MKRLLLVLFSSALAFAAAKPASLSFELSFPKELSATPLDGHVILMISKDDKQEPRFTLEEDLGSQQGFGLDVDGLAPGAVARVDNTTVGYPVEHLADLPAGDYHVQAIFNLYETFQLGNGKVVKLPPDKGEGQHWETKPGNLLSTPQKLHLDSKASGVVRIAFDHKVPPLEQELVDVDSLLEFGTVTEPLSTEDSKWLKHIRIQSELLTKFWGRPTYIGAAVLLPDGWEEHPDAHYPVLIDEDHYHRSLRGFRTIPPSPNVKDKELAAQKRAYQFFQDWTGGRLPRVIIVMPQHANPYFDDSYAVNSANLGPYGDAIMRELLPQIEKQFRAIGQGWARAVYGGSTGGWEALATQVFYPDDVNGAWSGCADPIDFRAYGPVNIYDDTNAFFRQGPFMQTPLPERRQPNGIVDLTMEATSRYEYVRGTHGRSGEQWDIWQAVYSPMGDDGYPKPIFDKRTGVIDKQVAAYWREHYDLSYIMQRDWATLGPKLAGKLHFVAGEGDTWYLNNAVHLTEKVLTDPKLSPPANATFVYGAGQPHCYMFPGQEKPGPEGGNGLQKMIYSLTDHMEKTAPKDADVKSWKY